jgi:hypothetical protein
VEGEKTPHGSSCGGASWGFLGARCSVAHREFSGISRRSGAQPDNAFDFANGFIGSAVTRASIIDPGRKYHGRRHRFSVVGIKLRRSLSNGRVGRSGDLADFPTDSYVPYVVNDFF